jgi:hypothetical protein
VNCDIPGDAATARKRTVAAAKLKLVGRHHTWHDGVREGQLRGEDGVVRKVLIRPLPDVPAEAKVLQATRVEARILARIQHQNVLRIEHVTALQGKAALVVEAFGGISLARVLPMLEARHTAIPLRAAVEIVTMVASAVDAATAPVPGEDEQSVIHPGPEPGEILVDSLGRIKLAGFRVARVGQPVPASPEGYAPPEGIDPLRPTAYGLGALLVELLTGAPPPPAGDDERTHERTLRRTTTRIAAKVGQAGWEDLVRIARDTLAFDPQQRLSSADFARELRAHTLEQRSPRLRTWAPAAIPELCRSLEPAGGARALDDPSQVATPRPEIDPIDGPPTVVGSRDPDELAQLMATFGPPRPALAEDPSEEMATEVVSPELLARIRAAPLEPVDTVEKTVPAPAEVAQVEVVEEPPVPDPAPPPTLAPPPSLPPLDDAPLRAGKLGLGPISTLPPLPEPDDAPTVKWTVGQPPPGSPPAAQHTDEVARLATEEAPTAEQPEAVPPPPRLPDPRAIAPEAPDAYGPLDGAPPPRKRRSGLLLLLPLAAALMLGAWTAWYFLPGLLASMGGTAPREVEEQLLSELLDPPDAEPVEPEGAPLATDPAETPEGDPALSIEPGPEEPVDPDLPSPPDRSALEHDPDELAAIAEAPELPEPAELPATASQATAREQAIAAIREDAELPDAPTAEPEDAAAMVESEPRQEPPADPEPSFPEPEQPATTEPAPSDPGSATDPGSGLFRVEFRAGHTDIYEIEVRCHQGSAKGAPPLVLNDAGKGPCRVTAFTNASGRMIAWIGLTGPATLTCFQDGQRVCQ